MHASSRTYDTIVIGLGAWGSAAARELARRGHRVLGLDQYAHPHPHGSSAGPSRVYREAAHEGHVYIPLTVRAGELYRELERESGAELLTITGALYIGHPDDELVAEVAHGFRQHGVEYEWLEREDVRRRFPAFHPLDGEGTLLERQAGTLWAERIVDAQQASAARRGADLRYGITMRDWQANGERVTVETNAGSFVAEHLVLALGSWLPEHGRMELKLDVERQVWIWLDPGAESPLMAPGLPVFSFAGDPPAELVYGQPSLEPGEGIKIAFHRGGAKGRRHDVDPEVHQEDVDRVRASVVERVPELAEATVLNSRVCRYTNAADRHWVLTRHPESDRVVVLGADTGRGMKFAPAIGEIAADFVEDNARDDLGTFDPQRFAVQ